METSANIVSVQMSLKSHLNLADLSNVLILENTFILGLGTLLGASVMLLAAESF